MKKIACCAALSIGLSFLPIAVYGATPTSQVKPPCRVDMGIVHESSSLATKYQVLAVKANARVICDKPLSHLVVFINLYKSGSFGPILLDKFISREYSFVPAGKRLKISGPIFVCVNWKSTDFFSTVSSDAEISGEKFKAPWRKSFKVKIECGN